MSYGSMNQMDLNSYYSLKGKRVIVLTFSLSIIIHIAFIIAFQGIFPFRILKSQRRAYKVHLIRPPIEDIAKSRKESDSDIGKNHSELPVETREATISLDTKNPLYHPYTRAIEEKILNHWIYPLSAKKHLIQGNLLIIFKLNSDGNLIGCNINRSSGYEILDIHAVQAIHLANPFPPFPENIPVQFLTIRASFAYQLALE
jgi:TonB family protein